MFVSDNSVIIAVTLSTDIHVLERILHSHLPKDPMIIIPCMTTMHIHTIMDVCGYDQSPLVLRT